MCKQSLYFALYLTFIAYKINEETVHLDLKFAFITFIIGYCSDYVFNCKHVNV